MKTCLKITLVTLIACAAAQAGDARAALKVQYADLNLDAPAGARVLMQRLKGAANQVCRADAGHGLEAQARFERCYEHALKDAVGAINKPTLNALFTPAAEPAQG